MSQNLPANLERGVAYLKNELKTLPNQPGVYRMLNEKGVVLYVGKARNLIRRVSNYTQPNRLSKPDFAHGQRNRKARGDRHQVGD
jgi:excinuclease ABC subunit C